MTALLRLVALALTTVMVAAIQAYRYLVSPMLPPSCRFLPTCSAYAIEALRTHGPIRGSLLAVRRIARCHPIAALGGSSGYDPVPPRKCRGHSGPLHIEEKHDT